MNRLFCFLIVFCICIIPFQVFAEDFVLDTTETEIIETDTILEENLDTEVITVSNDVEIELLKSIDSSLKYIINTFQGFIILCFFVLLYRLIFKLFAYCIF